MFSPWPELQARFDAALGALNDAYPARVVDLRNSSLFFFLWHLWECARNQHEPLSGNGPPPILVVTETTQRAARMQQFLATVERLLADREPLPSDYLVFPDFEPQNLFEYFDPPVEIVDARNQVLDSLRRGSVKVVVTSYKACWRKMPSPSDYNARQVSLGVSAAAQPRGKAEPRVGHAADPHPLATAGDGDVTSISRDELVQRLVDLGYRPTTTVLDVGEYAVRGGIVDVFPVGEDLPVRVDLFGNEIEQISRFSPGTQRTTEPVPRVRVLPLSAHKAHLRRPEVLGWLMDRWSDYVDRYRDVLARSALERLTEVVTGDLDLLESGADCARAGWYYRATASADSCLWHYLPEATHVVIHEGGFVESETASYFRFWRNRFDDWVKNGLSFLDLDSFYMRPPAPILDVVHGLSRGTLPGGPEKDELDTTLPQLKPLLTHAYGGPQQDATPEASVGLDNPPTGKWGTSKIAKTIGAYPPLSAAETYRGLPYVDRPVTILSQFSARLREVLEEDGLHPEIENAILPGGFQLPATDTDHPASDPRDETPVGSSAAAPETDCASVRTVDWTVITDVEVFGEIVEVEAAAPRRFRGKALRQTEELNPGDYVVHIDYGIGRFAQLAERQAGGVTKSFVEIEYAGRDRLYVPVEQLDRLRRYTYDGSVPQLSSLGRDTWRKTKEKVREDTLELARKLLSLYKTRRVRSGHAYSPTTVWEEEFAEAFPYRLTEDQLGAWLEVKRDMESDKPMDRLVCGDVGFGKTEIALRASFKACVDERQVLVLCPTTVLADQHYHTFSRRFRPFPFQVALLSRFQTKKEQKDVVEKLSSGRVDVVIATHRALSKDIEFMRLGLMVIDEEQRFGVKQKEQLKMRWPTVDVLAMSATPIPRTLHMSLIGIRDISLIETAPVARKPVKTYVGEYDEILVREAILRELGRGGQVYYLHNRVQDIDRIKERLERLVPDERVIVGHGQMREDRLEEVMHAFNLGAYKILLATTIIENGLDIPTVNTIVVDGAENLGLAQMHQLRGRVGRSPTQAYACFFHEPQRILTEEAQNRLHAIYNYAYLGAGYEIAQSDLRIRGAGNLLGEAQSGLARQVGFEYYCELLARSIGDVKALDEAAIEEWEDRPVLAERPGAQLDLPLPSFIPETYVADPVLRLDLLRDLAGLGSEEALDDFAAELEDRFGTPPVEVENLLMVVRIKNLATSIGVELLSYNRLKQRFEVRFFADEPDWFRRSPLLDSRFSHGGEQAIVLALPFEGQETGHELYEALAGLLRLKTSA